MAAFRLRSTIRPREVLDPATEDAELPEDLRRFLIRACAPVREERFGTTAEMEEAWHSIEWSLLAPPARVAIEAFEPWTPNRLFRSADLEDEEVRELLIEIVTAEGPLLCSRMYELFAEVTGARPNSRLNRIVYRMVSAWNGRLSQVEPLGGGQQDKTVYLSGTEPRVLRTLGSRQVRELPLIELYSHAAYARRVLGLSDDEESDTSQTAALIATSLALDSNDKDELVSLLESRL